MKPGIWFAFLFIDLSYTRDDLQNKMFSIRERTAKETTEYEEQLVETSKLIDQEEAKKTDLERSVIPSLNPVIRIA